MKKTILSLIIILSTATFFGCDNLNPLPPEVIYVDPVRPGYSLIGTYDSMDTAVVEMVDVDAKTITFLNHAVEKSYTLAYNDSTIILDKYDRAMSIAQIIKGEIVDVCFIKDNKKLVSIKQSPAAFSFENISKYHLDAERKNAIIGDENFRLKGNTLVTSDDRKVEIADIIHRDIITIRGIDREIWSIVVERGHGYLKLTNDAYAVGGWIEVGQNIIQKVTDNMLLVVPEGTFDVQISARGFSATRRVTIERNKETIIDLGEGEVIIEAPRTGKVVFSVTPATAMVYIDGEEVDIKGAIELEFGLYQVVCEAPLYDTVTLYIKVSQDVASVSITMDETGTNNSGGSVSDNYLTPPPMETGKNRVYMEAPVDVEVYQDGVYMGISPVYFEKVPGSHTITLRKHGYITKSYQIHLDNEANDVTYSFSALEKNSIETGNNENETDNNESEND